MVKTCLPISFDWLERDHEICSIIFSPYSRGAIILSPQAENRNWTNVIDHQVGAPNSSLVGRVPESNLTPKRSEKQAVIGRWVVDHIDVQREQSLVWRFAESNNLNLWQMTELNETSDGGTVAASSFLSPLTPWDSRSGALIGALEPNTFRTDQPLKRFVFAGLLLSWRENLSATYQTVASKQSNSQLIETT